MDMWHAPDEVQQQMKDLVGQNHPDLALVVDDILVLFRDKCATSAGRRIYGKAVKSNAYINATAQKEYRFLLVIGADGWDELNSRKREALLDHLLCACRCEEANKEGSEENLRTYTVNPPIQCFPDNVKRYGMWFPDHDEDSDEGLGPEDKTGRQIVGEAVNGEGEPEVTVD